MGPDTDSALVVSFPGIHLHGKVVDVGELTNAETLTANEKRSDYHHLTLPSSESDAPTAFTETVAVNVTDDVLAARCRDRRVASPLAVFFMDINRKDNISGIACAAM